MFAFIAKLLKFFNREKLPRQKDEGLLALSSSNWHWHNRVKTYQLVYVDIQIPQLLKEGID
jgi:hypothetical protein